MSAAAGSLTAADSAAAYPLSEIASTGGIDRLLTEDVSLTELDHTAADFYEALVADPPLDENRILGDYQSIITGLDLVGDKAQSLLAYYYLNPGNSGIGEQILRYRNFLTDEESYIRSLMEVALSFDQYAFLTDMLSPAEQISIHRGAALPKITDPANANRLLSLQNELRQLNYLYYQKNTGNADTKELTEIWLEMTKLRRQTAALYGYESFPLLTRASEGLNEDPKDRKDFYEAVREVIAPLYRDIKTRTEELEWNDLSGSLPRETDAAWSTLAPVLAAVHPALAAPAKKLTEEHLYLETPTAQTGYTAPLYTLQSAFIFTTPALYPEDEYQTLTHEFAHFSHQLFLQDHRLYAESHPHVEEFQAQGLELLTWHTGDRMLAAEENEAYRLFLLMKKLGTILDGAMIDELEQVVYAEPDMDTEGLGRLYASLYISYYGAPPEDSFAFAGITHLFDKPLYYHAYAVSGLNALELWADSLDAPDDAAERYMEALTLDSTARYEDLLFVCGLSDMQKAENIRMLGERLQGCFASDEDRRSSILTPIYEERAAMQEAARAARDAEERRRQLSELLHKTGFLLMLAALMFLPALFVSARDRKRIRRLETRLHQMEEDESKKALSRKSSENAESS